MLRLEVGIGETAFNKTTNEVVNLETFVLELEHSLASLSKWEEIFQRPFISSTDKSAEEILTYVKVMCLTPDVPDEVFMRLTHEDGLAINAYINNKMTATWFAERPESSGPPSQKIITAEIIYYWMISLGIPIEFQYWHLNKLFTLIQVFNEKNAVKRPLTKAEVNDRYAQRARLNAERKAKWGTTG